MTEAGTTPRLLGVVVAAILLRAEPAMAQVSARPSPDDVIKAWPAQAAKEGVEGVALMGCKIGPQGHPADCVVLKESPEGAGFGAALVGLQTKFAFDRAAAGQSVVLAMSWPPPDTWPDWPRNPAEIFGNFLRHTSGRGTVNIACIVEMDGAFSNCVITSETRPGGVLGRDALEAMSKARARPATYQGRPIRSVMQIPFRAGG